MIAPAVQPPAIIQPAPPVQSVVVPAQRAKPTKSSLPPIKADWEMWNNNRTWVRSQWSGGPFHAMPFFAQNIVANRNGEVVLSMNQFGEAELQRNIDPGLPSGFVQTDVTLPEMRAGVIASPLTLYDRKSGDEIVIQAVGLRGLELTVKLNGKSMPAIPVPGLQGDLSGRRLKLGISYQMPSQIVYFVNDKAVLTISRANVPGGVMPAHGFMAISSVWGYPKGASWAGAYTPLGAGEEVKMTIHGYAFTAAPALSAFDLPIAVAAVAR